MNGDSQDWKPQSSHVKTDIDEMQLDALESK